MNELGHMNNEFYSTLARYAALICDCLQFEYTHLNSHRLAVAAVASTHTYESEILFEQHVIILK